MESKRLDNAALAAGISPNYINAHGKPQSISAETKRRLLDAMHQRTATKVAVTPVPNVMVYTSGKKMPMLLQEQLAHQNQRLPELGALLKQVNHLLRQANLPGQFPLLVGYYHRELKNLILVSAGLNATLNTGEHQVQISNGVPLVPL